MENKSSNITVGHATNEGGSESRTYLAVVEDWSRERELLGHVLPYTAQKARQKAALLSPWIGSSDVAEIEPASITKALIELGSVGGRNRAGLSSSTLRAVHLAGTQAVDWAIDNGLAESNPFKKVERPKARNRPAQFLTPDQANAFANTMTGRLRACMAQGAVQQASFSLAACIALATGMRRGEIFALQWSDLDLGRMRISVARAVKGDGSVGGPKSASGVRNIAIGANLADLLAEVREWQSHAITGRGWAQAQYVICNARGERANEHTFEHWWRSWTDRNGWRGLRFHELRHSHATILIADGVDVKTVQMRLGHSSSAITLSVYAHALPIADSSAASSMDAALFA